MNTPKDSTGGCCPPPPCSAFEEWWKEYGLRADPPVLEMAYKEIAFKGWVAAAEKCALADTLRQMIETIESHEVTCFSCDRDGELYCDCIKRLTARAKGVLSANTQGEAQPPAQKL